MPFPAVRWDSFKPFDFCSIIAKVRSRSGKKGQILNLINTSQKGASDAFWAQESDGVIYFALGRLELAKIALCYCSYLWYIYVTVNMLTRSVCILAGSLTSMHADRSVGQYAYWPVGMHNDRSIGQYAYWPPFQLSIYGSMAIVGF